MSSKLKIWRESASLILAAKSNFSSPNPFNYKILCLQRTTKSKFMPDTYVFPGGNLSKSDGNTDWLKLYENFGFSKQCFNDLKAVENVPPILQNDEETALPKYLSFRICAIRETFEECGLLLCKNPKINSDTFSKWTSFFGGHELIAWQEKVNNDPNEFLNLCRHYEIVPDVWGLKNWRNWITPPTNKTGKFNAIFFIATLHQKPHVVKDEREIQNLMWTTPDECIELNKQQKVLLPVPQFYEMSCLKNVLDVDKLAEFATERSKYGFETFWPYRVKTNEGVYTIMQGDDLHPGKINKDDTEIPELIQLPGSTIKNRILHKSEYSNFMVIENYVSKSNHLIPSGSVKTCGL